MRNYRAYILGGDGHIVHRVDLLGCENDELATHRASLLVDGHTVELWDGDRKIATFEPPRSP
jgi:hypothetical protein